MTRPYWEVQAERDARERLQRAKSSLLDLRKQMDADTSAAWCWQDESGRYSPQGIADRRDELVREVQQKYQARYAAVRQQVQDDLERVERAAQAARPVLPDDAGTLMRAQIAWDGVKTRLAAGMTPSQILSSADQVTALAMAEWGPAYMEAQAYEVHKSSGLSGPMVAGFRPDHTALHRAVDARLAELDPDFGDAHAAVAEAAGVAGHVEPLAEQAALGFPTDRQGIASLAAHYGEQSALAAHGLTAADPVAADSGDAA